MTAGERDDEQADGPFCEVNFGTAKDKMSEAVVKSANSGNGEDENAVLHVQRQHLLEQPLKAVFHI